MTLLVVIVGGAAGAVVRYLIDRMLADRAVTRRPVGRVVFQIPLATLLANVAGSLLLGLLAGLGDAVPGVLGALLGTGFCGALTTWSTFAFQSIELGRRWPAVVNVVATLVLGFAAVLIGRSLAR